MVVACSIDNKRAYSASGGPSRATTGLRDKGELNLPTDVLGGGAVGRTRYASHHRCFFADPSIRCERFSARFVPFSLADSTGRRAEGVECRSCGKFHGSFHQ